MMYIGGADIVANKPMKFFDLVLFFSIHCYLCKKACIKTAKSLNANATSILFIMSCYLYSCFIPIQQKKVAHVMPRLTCYTHACVHVVLIILILLNRNRLV